MKESRLYLQFIKDNLFLLFVPVVISFLIGIYFYSSEITKTKLSQSFRTEYGLENMETSMSMADQAVAELRLADFDSHFPGTQALIYKPAPLIVSIEVLSEDKNTGFELLLKETEYLKKNFSVSTLTQIQAEIIEPSLFKYFLTSIILGGFAGLSFALGREYFKNY